MQLSLLYDAVAQQKSFWQIPWFNGQVYLVKEGKGVF